MLIDTSVNVRGNPVMIPNPEFLSGQLGVLSHVHGLPWIRKVSLFVISTTHENLNTRKYFLYICITYTVLAVNHRN